MPTLEPRDTAGGAVLLGTSLPIYLVVSFVVMAFEGSGHCVELRYHRARTVAL